jgi:hypothetical protein
MTELHGKVAAITGAASGLGRAMAGLRIYRIPLRERRRRSSHPRR